MEQRAPSSALLTTIITVLATGGVGGWFTYCYQERAATHAFERQRRAAEHELNKLWLEKRGDEALASRTAYLTAQRALAEQVFIDLAATTYATEQFLSVPNGDWSLQGLSGEALARKKAARAKLIADFNTAENKWKTSIPSHGIKLAYYTAGNPAVARAWTSLNDSTTVLLECAQNNYLRWYRANVQQVPHVDDPTACEAEQRGVTSASTALASVISTSAQYMWKGWESPQALRKELGLEQP